MGTYFRPLPWVKVTHTKRRGLRVALGPRFLRSWFGKGPDGRWHYQGRSTGWGPFSRYTPPARKPPARRRLWACSCSTAATGSRISSAPGWC